MRRLGSGWRGRDSDNDKMSLSHVSHSPSLHGFAPQINIIRAYLTLHLFSLTISNLSHNHCTADTSQAAHREYNSCHDGEGKGHPFTRSVICSIYPRQLYDWISYFVACHVVFASQSSSGWYVVIPRLRWSTSAVTVAHDEETTAPQDDQSSSILLNKWKELATRASFFL